MTCGIYEIINTNNGKKYIGQSINIEHRWRKHQYELNTQKHYNDHLQKAWNKYGADSFVFQIIEKCSRDKLDEKEIFWIKEKNTYNNGYNLDKGGTGVLKYPKKYYRVIKKGIDNGQQRYQLIKDNYSKPILTTIFKDEVNKMCQMLNDGQITENEVLILMKKKEKKYRNTHSNSHQGYIILKNLGINYLISEVKNGRRQQDIMNFYNVSQKDFNMLLNDNNITWKDIVIEADMLKIKEYDKEYDIQKQLNNGTTVHQVRKNIGCTEENFKKYRKDNNIYKSHLHNKISNTGVRHVSYLSIGTYQYRRTKENLNNIQRKSFIELEKVAKERGLEWIIDDESKYIETIKKEKRK